MTIEEQSNIAYLNVTVHDASMAVKKRVREKLGKFPKPVQNQAAQAACFFTTPKKSAQVLSQRLCEELPCMFSKRGINIEVEEIFREGPYIVLKLLVLNVDTQAMDKNWIRWFTRTFGFKERIEKDLCKCFHCGDWLSIFCASTNSFLSFCFLYSTKPRNQATPRDNACHNRRKAGFEQNYSGDKSKQQARPRAIFSVET
jgi:hypothetical protein